MIDGHQNLITIQYLDVRDKQVDKIIMSTENKREMKLAEALLLRSDLLKKIEHIQNRIIPVLIVSDDKHPQEDPIKL